MPFKRSIEFKDHAVNVRRAFFAIGVVFALAGQANARATPDDLQVAARALGFMERPLGGDVRLGILYAPDSPVSVKAADDLQKALGSGLRVGSTVLHPVLLRIDQPLAGKADVLFLDDGLGPAAARLADAARGQRMPCVTTDIDLVRSGACAIGVNASPRVQVFVSRQAAARTGVSFSTVFRILVTEL